MTLVYITQPGEKFKKIKLDDSYKYDFGETTILTNLLEKYSRQGWMVKNSNMSVEGGNYYFYYLLYRKNKMNDSIEKKTTDKSITHG